MTDPRAGDAMAELKPWPFNGYAPGTYSCSCHRCQCQFDGDKRAVTCLECAVILSKDAAHRIAHSPASEVTGEMVEALTRLEAASDAVAGARTHEQYLAMIE